MALEDNKYDRLQELSGSDFEIADNQPDIKSWEIFDSAGDYIGDVEDLIFDRESRKVRYILTDLDIYDSDEKKQVLIPIGLVTLKDDEDEVILTEAISANLPLLPEYKKGNITPAEELQIRNVLTGSAENVVDSMNYNQHEDDFYNHQHFSDRGYNKNPAGRDGLDPGQII